MKGVLFFFITTVIGIVSHYITKITKIKPNNPTPKMAPLLLQAGLSHCNSQRGYLQSVGLEHSHEQLVASHKGLHPVQGGSGRGSHTVSQDGHVSSTKG